MTGSPTNSSLKVTEMARLQRVQMISSEASSDDIKAIYYRFVVRVNEVSTAEVTTAGWLAAPSMLDATRAPARQRSRGRTPTAASCSTTTT